MIYDLHNNELAELRNRLAKFQKKQPKVDSEIDALQNELHRTRLDVQQLEADKQVAINLAEQWQSALYDARSSNRPASQYRYEIAMLKQDMQGYEDKLQERDEAIERLVSHSLVQERKYRDQISKLEGDAEALANQVLDQEEEIKKSRKLLKVREKHIVSQQKHQTYESSTIQTLRQQKVKAESHARKYHADVIAMEGQISKLKLLVSSKENQIQKQLKEIDTLRDLQEMKQRSVVSNISEGEMKKLQTENELLEQQLRDVRREFWSSKDMLVQENHDLQGKLTRLQKQNRTMSEQEAKIRQYEKTIDEYQQEKQRLVQQMESKVYEMNQTWQRKLHEQKVDAEKERKEQLQSLREQLMDRKEQNLPRDEEEQQQDKMLYDIPLGPDDEEDIERKKQVQERQQQVNNRTATMMTMTTAMTRRNRQLVIERDELVRELAKVKKELETYRDTATRNRVLIREKDELNRQLIKLKEEIKTSSSTSLQQKTKEETTTTMATNQSIDDLVKEKEALVNELSNVKEELKTLRQEVTTGNERKTELEQELQRVQKAREDSEKSLAVVYDRRLAAVTMDRDVTIDGLRNELIQTKTTLKAEKETMMKQLETLQTQNGTLHEQFQHELNVKEKQIYALEHTLHAQEQVIDTMRDEMDQLQHGMATVTSNRRGEVETLQQEIMVIESKSKQQDRTIGSLKLQIDENVQRHRDEVNKLNQIIEKLGKESPLEQKVAQLQKDDLVLEVRERLEQLKKRNTSLQEENLKLGGKLERSIMKIQGFEVERKQHAETERELIHLRKQVTELEALLSKQCTVRPTSDVPTAASSSDKKNNKNNNNNIKTTTTTTTPVLRKQQNNGAHPRKQKQKVKMDRPSAATTAAAAVPEQRPQPPAKSGLMKLTPLKGLYKNRKRSTNTNVNKVPKSRE